MGLFAKRNTSKHPIAPASSGRDDFVGDTEAGGFLFVPPHEWGLLDDDDRDDIPYAAARIVHDEVPYALYQVENSDDCLGYTIALIDQPSQSDEAWTSDQTTFYVMCHPMREGGPGYALIGGYSRPQDAPRTGLDRDAARAHPRVRDLWELVDWLTVTDPMINYVLENGMYPEPDAWNSWMAEDPA